MQVGLSIRYGHDTIRVVDPTTMLIEYVCDIPIREGLVIVESAFQKLQHQLDYRDFHTTLSEAKRVPGASKARYIADIYKSFIGIASRNVGAFGIFRCGAQARAAVRDFSISWGLSGGCGSHKRAPHCGGQWGAQIFRAGRMFRMRKPVRMPSAWRGGNL